MLRDRTAGTGSKVPICMSCERTIHAHTMTGVKSPTELAGAFRAKGLKVTPQRQLLFTLLDGNTSHPTAEGLYTRASQLMPGISLRTVYTTLTDLADMGELQLVALGSGAIRFDPEHRRPPPWCLRRLRIGRRPVRRRGRPARCDGSRRLRHQFHLDRVPRHLRNLRERCVHQPASSNTRPVHQHQGDNPWLTSTAPRPTRT